MEMQGEGVQVEGGNELDVPATSLGHWNARKQFL